MLAYGDIAVHHLYDQGMKIAIVHELLTKRGGAERMVKILADMFPKAPIYTLLYNEAKLCDWFPRHRVRVGPLQKTANILRHSPFSILHSIIICISVIFRKPWKPGIFQSLIW